MDNENMALRFEMKEHDANNDMTDVSGHPLRRLHSPRGFDMFAGVETVARRQSERTGGEETVERYVPTEGERKSNRLSEIFLHL